MTPSSSTSAEKPIGLRSVEPADARVLRDAALRGRAYVLWPHDSDWLQSLKGIGDPPARLRAMASRGSLAPVGHGRWVIMPPAASSLDQAGPRDLLVAALLDGRVSDWYIGFWTALLHHGLTDVDADAVFVGARGAQLPKTLRAGALVLRTTTFSRSADWQGVERFRVQGRVFAYRSDPERTLLDTLERPRLCGPPDVWVRAWERAAREERVDVQRLLEYSEGRNDTVQARCAFWLREIGEVRVARRIMRGLGGPLNGRRPLDASASFGDAQAWHRDRETGLTINMPMDAIEGWMEYGK
ncbi:MAG TPA: hypothetical protein VNT54_13675 [Solirubrobacteraceae bacterium]|nr:hypothetical protein [Solirubrobacteraceae bacterium]